MIKPIPDFPGYSISDDGYVYSEKTGSLKILRVNNSDCGRRTIMLRRDGKSYRRKIARLVLQTFLGECPPGMECLHGLDGRFNDSINNLSWGTHKKNLGEDRRRDGTLPRGEKQGGHKLKKRDVYFIRLVSHKMKQEVLGKIMGVRQETISDIVTLKSWAWL